MALNRPFPFTPPGTSNSNPNGGFTGNTNIGGNAQIPQSASIDIPIEDAYPNIVMEPFGSSTSDKVELHISSMVDSLLESTYNVPYEQSNQITSRPSRRRNTNNLAASTTNPNINSISVNIHKIFRNLGYISGKFKFQLNFHRSVLGNFSNTANLAAISPDRTELTISYTGRYNTLETAPLVDSYGNRIEFYLNLGGNQLFRIASFVLDTTETTASEKIYILTLQNPLPDEIGINTDVWIDIQVADPQTDTIVIYPKKKKEEYVQLRNPNFGLDVVDRFSNSTGFQTWDTLLGSNPTSSQQLINKFISSSFNPIELNVDYRDYSNFVFYSSAEERLRNFKYKVQLIEYYDSLINVSNNISSPDSSVIANINDLITKKNNLLAGFDGYEQYLYFESSSYESSSYGEFTPTTWPKTNSNKPYTLYSITSSQASSWFEGQLSSASLYDKNNINALVYLIPEHIRESRNNESYSTFVNMIGQHFDILWSYVNQLSYVNSRRNPVEEGLAKDLIYHVLRSFGIDSINGFKIEELWFDALGLNASGSYTQSGSLQSIPTRDISKETWKRILNNLPYLLKTKGTKRGIRALINCYGVPNTVYRIKEYSYPYQYNSNTIELENQYRRVEKFTYGTLFTGSNNYITANMSGINTLQFRFKPIYVAATQSLMSGTVEILIYPSGSNGFGYLKVGGGTPMLGPYYNGNWNNVTLTTSNAYVYQFNDGSLIGISGSGGTVVGNITFGQGANDGFTGYMQEIRGWTTTLNKTIIEQHARNPQAIIGNNTVDNIANYDYTSAYTQLKYRYPLGTTLQIFTGSSATITSIQPDRTNIYTATAFNFTTASFVGSEDIYYVWYPNVGDGLDIANKIRIEDSALDGDLSNKHSVERNQFDSYTFDSPKVGVFFSPQDEINEDIAEQFSGISLDNILGDPRDDYEYTYRGLDTIRNHYHRKYNNENSFWKYVKLIENFDASMFYLIKKFLPARAVKMVGLVIQPTLLERVKVPIRKVQSEDEHLEANYPQLPHQLIGDPNMYEANPIIVERDMDASYDTYDNSIYTSNVFNFSGEFDSYEAVIPTTFGALSSNVEYVNDNTATRFIPAGRFNHMFGGCRISSRGFNIPSADTFDGQPVVEFWTNNPNNPTNNPNSTGQIQTGPIPLNSRILTGGNSTQAG